MRRPLRIGAAALAMAVTSLAVLVTPALATPAPKRPHPFRKPWPITVTIQTVPALRGVRFTFDDLTLRTDATGRASFTQEHNFRTHTLVLVDRAVAVPGRHYQFSRWAGQRDPDQAFRSTVTGLPMRANYTVTAAFSVQYPVTPRFVDQRGHPVDLNRIDAVKVKSSTGQLLALPRSGTVWLDGRLPIYGKSELSSNSVSYALQSVVVDGTNTVDVGRQKFQPVTTTSPVFTVKFYDLTIRAHDAMFHGAVGRRAVVTFPDGTVRTASFGPNHAVTLRNLARGPYAVTMQGAGGIVAPEELALSRDNVADISVVSVLDLAVIAGGGLLLAATLLLLGRARLRQLGLVYRRRRMEPSTT